MSTPELDAGARTESDDGRLYELYARYVGEPQSRKDVWGYWLFLAGALISFVGVFAFLFVANNQAEFFFRGLSIFLSALGLPIALLGIVLLLPVKRRSIYVTVLGALISLAGSAAFVLAYPANWPPIQGPQPDHSGPIIAAYTVGLGVIVGVAVLVPILTGEKSLFFQEEYERSREYPPVAVGEAIRGGLFTVYRDGDEWEWRLIDQEAIAGSASRYLSRLETEESVDRIREKVKEAGLLEIKHAAFRLYEAAENRWRWVLMSEDGSIVADSDEEFETRNNAANAVNNLKELGPNAEVINIEGGGAFEYVEDGSDVRWRLVDEERSVLAEGPTAYGSQSAAQTAMNLARESADSARTLALETIGIEIFQDDAVTDGGSEEVEGADADTGADEVEEAASEPDDDGFVYDEEGGQDPAEELTGTDGDPVGEKAIGAGSAVDAGGSWRWRLVDNADEELARSEDVFDSRRSAEEAVYDLLEDVANAPMLDSDQPTYECVPAPDSGWQFRLVDRDEHTVATSIGDLASSSEATSNASTMRDSAASADIITIETAEFEYYRTSGGWHWRLVTESRDVLAESTDAFETKEAAADAIEQTKGHAEEAELIEFENAAFQLYEHEGEWRWRLIDEDGNVMADSGEEHENRDSAAASMMTIKEQAPDAEVLEIENAAFELFHDEHDQWNWRLVDISGETVSRGPEMLPSREAARQAMDRLVAAAGESDSRAMESAVFQVYADAEDDWRWRFVHPDGTLIAASTTSYGTRDEAATEIESNVRDIAGSGSVHTIERLAMQIDARGERYSWRVLRPDRSTVATSSRSYTDRQKAVGEVELFRDNATDAAVFELSDATFQVQHVAGGWQWRLIDGDRTELLVGPSNYGTRGAAEQAIDRITDIIQTADVLDYEGAAFELYEAEDRWKWQLVDEDGEVMASSAQDYSSKESAGEALEIVREELDDASILEIEIAAFELQEDDGLWRWRLIDENGTPIAESLTQYDSRREARESMETLQEHAPEAMTEVAE